MTESRKVQLGVEVDASGAKKGFDQVKQEAKAMAQAVGQSGKDAGKGIDGIGSSGDSSAKKVEAATKSMIQAIQRTTAAMEAGSRTSSKYYETLASQRGVDVNALKPYLTQLDAVAAKQSQAGISAGQMSAALRGLPAQFTDIATSLASGQAPLTVLLQQGGQIKDQFGGIGTATKALGGYMLSLVNPLTVAAGAVVGLAVAYNQGSKEADAYTRALILTGNAAGVTANQLGDMAARVGKSVGTQGSAAAALTEMAGTGRIAAGNLEYFSRVAIQMEKTVGQSAKDTAKDLADLGKSPLEASERLNEKYHYLTAAVYAQIKAFQDQGKEEEAAATAQQAYADAFDKRTKQIQANLGIVESAFRDATGLAKSFWDTVLNVGRKDTLAESLSKMGESIALAQSKIAENSKPGGGLIDQWALNFWKQRLSTLQQEQGLLQENLRIEQRSAAAQAESVRQEEARNKWIKDSDKYLSRQQQFDRALERAKNEAKSAGVSEDSNEFKTRIDGIKREYADLLNVGLEALRGRQAVQRAALDGDLDSLERQHKQLLVSDEQYFAKKQEIQLRGIELDKEMAQKQADIAAGKKDQAERQKYLNELELLEQKRVNIIKSAQDEITGVFLSRNKTLVEQADKWRLATLGDKAALQDDIALLGKSAEARAIAAEQQKVDAEARKLLADMESKGQALTVRQIDNLLEEAAARKQNIAAIMGQRQAEAGYDQLRKENRRFAAESILDEQQRAAALLEIDAEIWRERIQKAGEGTAAQKQLQQQFDEWYANRQMSPVIDRWKNIVSNLDNDFREGFRNMLSNGQGVWKSFSKSLGNTLETSVADALYQAFAKKYVVQAVMGVASVVSGPAVASAIGGNNALSTAGNIGSIASGTGAIGSAVAGFGSGVMAGAGGADAAMLAYAQSIGNVSASASAGASLGSVLGAIPGWGWALAGAALLAHAMDDSGTKHTGGAARSTVAGGTFGMNATELGFMDIDVSKQTEGMVSQLASSIANVLDSTAKTFGKDAAFNVMTAFADDSSKDGAWGALRIQRGAETVVDWDANRQSRWAPREFADGDAGRNQYLAELSRSVRTALDDIGLPGWAKSMLSALGESPSIETLAATVDKINAAQAAIQTLGKNIAGFANLTDGAASAIIAAVGGVDAFATSASAFYDGYFSEQEKVANVSKQVEEALSKVSLTMPQTRDEFRALVDAQLALGEAGAPAVATLLNVAGAFGTVADFTKKTADEAIANAKRLADQRSGLEIQIMELTGDASGALAKQRSQELAGLEASLVPLQERIYLLQDEKTAADAANAARQKTLNDAMQAVDEAYSAVQRAVEAERKGVTAAYNEQVSDFNDQIKDITGSVGKLSSLSSSLKSTLERMRLPTDLASDRAAASAQIETALLMARVGGVLPDTADLAQALNVISQPAEDLYASFSDYQRAQLVERGKIEELAKLTDSQLSVEERTLKAVEDQKSAAERAYADEMARLDGVVSAAQSQIDVLKGIDKSVLSVAAAIAGLEIKINAASAAQAAVSNASGTQADVITGLFRDILGRAPEAAGASFWQTALVTNPKYKTGESSIIRDFIEGAVHTGGTDEEKARAWARANGIQGFDVGTNWVNRDRIALIHEGERVLPKADNRALIAALQNPAQSNDANAAEMRALRADVNRLQQVIAEGNEYMRQLAEQFDNVTEGGNAMRSEVLA